MIIKGSRTTPKDTTGLMEANGLLLPATPSINIRLVPQWLALQVRNNQIKVKININIEIQTMILTFDEHGIRVPLHTLQGRWKDFIFPCQQLFNT